MTDYNWNEIIKNKSDKELFKLSLGNSYVPTIAVDLAKVELIRRGINDQTIEKHKKKWELEDLIEEERLSLPHPQLFLKSSWIIPLIMSVITFIMGLLDLFELINIKSNLDFPTSIGLFLFSLFGIIMTVVAYKKDQHRRQNERKIKDIINQL